jgi:hypothetical protein
VINAEYTVVGQDGTGPSAADQIEAPEQTRDKR